MSLRFSAAAAIAAALLSAVTLASNDARACGGCFVSTSQTTVVTGHRMAVSVSMQRTVLWDQIQYSGSPEDFAWVLPIKPGAYLELGSNAFFEALDAATSTTVVPPLVQCTYPYGEGDGGYYGGGSRGCSLGCMSAAEADGNGNGAAVGAGGATGGHSEPPVTVVHEESVGPYDTVTVHSNKPGALYGWLTSHSYDIPKSVEPVIDAYEKDGFDFIALRLTPGNGVQLMQPVRVITPGAAPALPLRMVAAGTGANVAITLFVIGEGRWEPNGFPTSVIDSSVMTWDFDTKSSSYAKLRQSVLATNQGRTWIASYAKRGALVGHVQNPVTMQPTIYNVSNGSSNAGTIGELYVRQAEVTQPGGDESCLSGFLGVEDSPQLVVDPCADQGAGGAGGGGVGTGTGTDTGTDTGTGTETAPKECNGVVGPDEIDARTLACGKLDDIEAALIGMHPADTWVTRLEASLPQSALDQDLLLQASATQAELEGWHTAAKYTGNPCPNGGTPAAIGIGSSRTPPPRDPGERRRNELAIYACLLAAAAATLGRRLLRPALRVAKASR